MRIEGAYRVRVFYKNKAIDAPFLVASDAAHSILGLNIIRPMRLALDPLSGTVDFQDYAAVAALAQLKAAAAPLLLDSSAGPISFADARVLRDTTIKASSARMVTLGLFDHNGRRILRDFSGLADMDIMAVAFTADKNGTFCVHIPNAAPDDWKLPAHTRVAAIYDLDDWTPLSAADTTAHVSAAASAKPLRPHTPAEKAAIREAITQRVNASVPYQFREDYITALLQREHFFSASPEDLGFTDALQHSLDLQDKQPAFSPQFRLPADHLRLIQQNVAGWLQAGIVERSDSKYNAPIFCVPKKHGAGMRCVLDYRRLNAKSLSDKYSIRTIDECLEAIGRAESKIFSCLDLTNGYWQLKLRASDRPFTAFTIPGKGQFQWITTPQGLMGAPASFSRLMDVILSDAENVITYIDDVLVHSRDHRAHIPHLVSAIDRIGRANLRLNPSKCTFGASEVEYLGHTLTSNGVRPGTDKAAAVRDAPVPHDQKTLKSFLGLANYFRQYVPNFSLRAAPLFLLTRQDSEWKSGPLPPAARTAFTYLRDAISSRPVMAFPRATGRLHLFVDACLGDSNNVGGLGAVLMQDQPRGDKRPIAYASRRLTKHEANYPAFLAEMQAAVYGMDTFHHYLVGRRFSLYTDHKPLTKLSSVHKKTLNRLQLKMTELHPEIRYIEGKKNVVADFLSRYHGMNVSGGPPPDPEAMVHAVSVLSHRQAGHPVHQIDASPFRLMTLQRLDPALKLIIDSAPDVASSFSDPKLFDSPHCRLPVTIIQDVLFVQPGRRKGVLSAKDLRVAIPHSMRKEIIDEAHNSWIGGHGGVFKTTERIKAEFWWPSMALDIETHVRDCSTCLRATNKGLPAPPPLQPLPEPAGPNRRIHADLFGPLKDSVRKNNFVLVITDAFSKLARAIAIPAKDAPVVAAAMVDHMFLFGVPETIMTDQGMEFCNQLQRQIWDSLDIRHDVTTPYHPQCNAGAEVFNKTMKHYLATAIIDSDRSTLDWELYLGPLMFSYNTSINSSTKTTPFETTFGYDPRIPLWDGIAYPGDETVDQTSFADYLARLRHAQLRARQIAHHNNQHVRQQYADKHDHARKAELPSFEAGDKVFVRDMKSNDPNPKLRDIWKPAVIVGREGFATYRIRREDRKRKPLVTMNAMHLKHRPADATQPPPPPPPPPHPISPSPPPSPAPSPAPSAPASDLSDISDLPQQEFLPDFPSDDQDDRTDPEPAPTPPRFPTPPPEGALPRESSSSSSPALVGFDSAFDPVLQRPDSARSASSPASDTDSLSSASALPPSSRPARAAKRPVRYAESSSSASEFRAPKRALRRGHKRGQAVHSSDDSRRPATKQPLLRGQKRSLARQNRGFNKRLRAYAIHLVHARRPRVPLSDDDLRAMSPDQLLHLVLFLSVQPPQPGLPLPPAPRTPSPPPPAAPPAYREPAMVYRHMPDPPAPPPPAPRRTGRLAARFGPVLRQPVLRPPAWSAGNWLRRVTGAHPPGRADPTASPAIFDSPNPADARPLDGSE